MTFEEAKKILEKEFAVINLHKSTEPFEFDDSNWFGYEKPSVLEAFRVLSKEGYYITISGHDYDMRKKRLEKEYEKNTKAPGSGEEQPKEKKGIIYPTTFPKADFYHKHVLNEGNPALKESASQFNDALLDEQAKKIKRLGKEIARLNGIIHDKNAILSDVAEELRLSKIREKNLTEVGQKYMKEVEDLREKLANKVVDKIDAQALKSAESALAYKEKVIAEKNEVIADLTHELKAKHKKYVWYKGAYDAAQQILNTIADYAAKHPDKKFSDQMVGVDNAEEGKDHSAKVVLCGKDVVKKFKENEESVFNFFKRHKETAEELYEVADEALDQLLLFGEVIIKSEK